MRNLETNSTINLAVSFSSTKASDFQITIKQVKLIIESDPNLSSDSLIWVKALCELFDLVENVIYLNTQI